MMVTGGRSCLVGAGYTPAMLYCAVGTWNQQDNDCIGWALGISTTPGSDVT
jgi:hypothetical protein